MTPSLYFTTLPRIVTPLPSSADACAQVSAIESFYIWEGEVRHEGEFRVLFKTTGERYAAVEAAIRELHGYALPAIHAVAFA